MGQLAWRLTTLTAPEKEVITNVYQVRKYTYIPSVFGANNLDQQIIIRSENSNDYWLAIVTEINNRLVGKTKGTQRAVLVFFETRPKLVSFLNSQNFAQYKDTANIMTEELTLTEKDQRIKRATTSGQVTLATRVFGRGTDFVCRDLIVAANGGVHVLQTFLSEEFSEETQIKGRTARQGDQGSYSVVLLDQELERFGVKQNDIISVRQNGGDAGVGKFLSEKRDVFFKEQYANNSQFVGEARRKHQEAQKFLENLYAANLNAVKEFLRIHNRGASGNTSSRTICLMDATGSMSHLLQKSKNTVGTMFERATTVLQQNGMNPDSFSLQFAVYRNYSSLVELILQYSPWETKSENLRKFMDTISVSGGMGNEAIEIGLWHVNREAEQGQVSQVILIGDMPPNTEKEVQDRRQHYRGEQYWRASIFGTPTFYRNELQILEQKQIPVHAFFVANAAAQSFQEIANATNGKCGELDINSPRGAEMLAQVVTEAVLEDVGGSSQGKALVEAYRKAYL